MTDLKTPSLYIANNGRIACIRHGGSYLSSAYAAHPERDSYSTPIYVWDRMDDEYVLAYIEMADTHPKCEDC